jgi:hypothetical protein
MGEILVGTASWTDKTLIESGRFYPRTATNAEARLRYYATQFSLVEIDSTYYAVPAERTAELWAERTPARPISCTGTRRIIRRDRDLPRAPYPVCVRRPDQRLRRYRRP